MEKNNEIHVVKRNGSRVPFELSKWQAQIAKVCEGVADVSPSMIEMAAQAQFFDGMSTKKLDEIALRAMVDLIDELEHPDVGHVNYQHAAGKQRISMLRKDVYGAYTPPRLYDIVKTNVEKKLYTPDLLEWYTEAEWDLLERAIDHDKDEALPYAAVEQLCEKYLVQNRATGEIVETPQVRYMVAAATAFHAEKKDRLKWVKEFYAAASDGMFTLATPVLAGLGTKTKQFSSCVLIKSDDTLKSIFASGQVMADYASKKAGIGLDVGRLRPLGAPIRNGEIKHTGFVPFLKKWFADLRSCSAGGIRNAACTVTYPIWHYQFDDLIVLKNNQGTEENRVRHMDYSVSLNAFFWRRFKQKGIITFFDPNEVKDLYEAFHRDTEEFEKLYVSYEKNAKTLGLRTKSLPAETVFKDMLLKERGETGRIYLLNVDNVMNQGPFDSKIHPIYQSNLCFSGDTLVAVADGRNAVRIEELVSTEFDVYSAVKAGGRSTVRGIRSGGSRQDSAWKTVIRKARAIKTGERELVRVHLEDGDYFDTTPDHRLATTVYGKWIEAGESLGVELEPFATFAIGAKYRGIQSVTSNYQHRKIWEHANGRLEAGFDIDHIDRFGNDRLENLQALPHAVHLEKTRLEIMGSGNNIHRVDKADHSAASAKNGFLSRNGNYSGYSDEDLIKLAREYQDSGNKLTVNGLCNFFKTKGAPQRLSKNRFQRAKELGFVNAWQYLIACVRGDANYLEPIDYTADTIFKRDRKIVSSSWARDAAQSWKGRRVVRVEALGISDCYDVQVIETGLTDDEHNFYVITSGDKGFRSSKGVLVHNCQEVLQHTRPFQTVNDPNGRIAMCTLGSLNWGAFRHPDELRRSTKLLVRMLHNLLQYQDFLSIQSELHNKEFEPLGLGVTNLAYWHAKRKLKYGEPEALTEVKRWIEHMAFYATEASVDLAKEKGKCLESDSTWYGKGIFPWERRAPGVNELTDFTPELDWEDLRINMKTYGIRNTTLLALPPVESSSVVINSTNGISMVKDLIMLKSSKAGDFAQVVPEYKKLKQYYQLLWDQPDCIEYIKTVAVLQAYVDQGISSDTFYSPKFFPGGKIPVTLIAKNLMLAHKWGLKAHYYALTDAQAFKSLVDNDATSTDEVAPEEATETVCEACVL